MSDVRAPTHTLPSQTPPPNLGLVPGQVAGPVPGQVPGKFSGFPAGLPRNFLDNLIPEFCLNIFGGLVGEDQKLSGISSNTRRQISIKFPGNSRGKLLGEIREVHGISEPEEFGHKAQFER